MSTQDNLANQEKVVVNGKYCVKTESLCVLKEIDVLIQNCLIGVNIKFLCVDTGFFLCKAVSRVLFLLRKLLFE